MYSETQQQLTDGEIEMYSPKEYRSWVGISAIRPRISPAQIQSALTQICPGTFKVQPGNIAVGDGQKIHYRICTKRPGSPFPWYSVSDAKLEELQKNGINEMVCLYFDDGKGSYYNTYFKVWNITDISIEWKKEETKGKVLYRWNPGGDFAHIMKKTESGTAKGRI